jgi:hypothetical protein
MTTPLIPFKWLGIAQDVYNEYLSIPYSSPSIQNDWQYTHSGITIARPNHGLAHTLRTAAYVSHVVQAYNFFTKGTLSSLDTEHIQLALLFYVVGRENEASFGNAEYLKFRQKSADAFETYIRKKLPQEFTATQLQFYKTGIYNAYSDSSPHYLIIRICHDLDLLRCYNREEYNKKLHEAATYVGPMAQPLAELAEECLLQTGDRILGQQNYDGPLFTLCSTNPEETLRKINVAFQLKIDAIMQPVNASQPIPSGLKAPVPKTPWNVSPQLFARVQNQPGDPFTKCEVLPTDPEAAFVLAYFMHQKPHNYAIKRIYCIHNPDQTLSFEAGVKIIEREAENPINTPKGKNEAPQHERDQALRRWQACTTSFSPIKIKGPKRTDKYTEVKVLPLWHGTNQAVCQSVCTSGFTSFGKHHYFNSAAQQGANASTDIGYFGSGIYFTNSANYAAMYSSGHLLLSWVSMREPYPVVNDVPHPAKGSDMKKLAGQGHYQNYNAHYIPVASIKPHDSKCMQYYPCYQNQAPAWDEFVVFDNKQTVPRFWIELGLDSPQHPLKDPFVPVVSVAQTVLAVQKKAQPAAVQAAQKAQAPVPVQAVKAPTLPAWVFGASEWNKYFGDVGTEPPLPDDIIQRLPELSKNNVLVLIPATVNGKPLTLKTLGKLVQNPKNGGHKTTYTYFKTGEYVDQPAKSHWALLTRSVIEGSRDKLSQDEQPIVDTYSQKTKMVYEIPTVLDAAVCNMMEYVRSGTWLYGENPLTYTWCQEKYDANCYLVVGGGSGSGLYVYNNYIGAYVNCGVGGLRKF